MARSARLVRELMEAGSELREMVREGHTEKVVFEQK
jgi:hypothetical protein